MVGNTKNFCVSKKDIDLFLAGVIQPSDEAYVDVIVNESDVNLTNVSIVTSQDQSFSGDYTTTHELRYKGEAVWRTSRCQKSRDKGIGFKSACQLDRGRLVLLFEGRQSNSVVNNPMKARASIAPVRQQRKLDIESLIRGSAVAYQMYAAEEELVKHYTILNADNVEEESFSEYIVEVSDEDEEDSSEDEEDSACAGRNSYNVTISEVCSGLRDVTEEENVGTTLTPSHESGLDQTRMKSLMDDEASVASDFFTLSSFGFLQALNFLRG